MSTRIDDLLLIENDFLDTHDAGEIVKRMDVLADKHVRYFSYESEFEDDGG